MLSNASLYLSVPQVDSYNVEDLIETEDPDLLYIQGSSKQNFIGQATEKHNQWIP